MLSYVFCSYRFAALAKQSGRPGVHRRGVLEICPQLERVRVASGGTGLLPLCLENRGVASGRVEWARAIAMWDRILLRRPARPRGGPSSESLETLDKVGDYYAIFAHHWLRHIASVRGDIPGEIAEAEAEVRLGTERGNDEALAWGFYGKANALARAAVPWRLGASDKGIELTREKGSLTCMVASLVLGFVRVQASDYGGHVPFLERWQGRS